MKSSTVFWFFLGFWVLQSLLTAYFTELYSDEAYYWMYSRFMDWGYFDHPPMVAVMIWLGTIFGKTEMAVRIVNILLTAGAITIMYYLVQPKRVLTFCLCVFSFLSLHLLGFISLPDTPFFFFALVFILLYKRFLEEESWLNILLLGTAAALMLYSKYHGVLVIGFTVLSNTRLLINYRFWAAGLFALLLFSPHIWWQVNHNFPSLNYHLVARATSYSINQTLDYAAGNLPFHGGLVALVLFIASFYYTAATPWEKALKWNLYGTLAFFFFITFKGQFIEPNWTLFCVFPLLYLGYRYIELSKWQKSFHVLCLVFACILLFLKVHLMHPLWVVKGDRVWDFHLSKGFAQQVDSLAGNRLIVANSYQSASLLNFYTDKDYYITALNINGRANQYSLWQLDSAVCNRDIAYVNSHLEGPVVQGRNFIQENVTKLDNATSIAGIGLEILESRIENNQVHVTVAAERAAYLGSCTFDDMLELEFSVYRFKELVMQHRVPFAAPGASKVHQEYTLPLEQPEQATQYAVRVVSNKWGGGTNGYAVLNVNAAALSR